MTGEPACRLTVKLRTKASMGAGVTRSVAVTVRPTLVVRVVPLAYLPVAQPDKVGSTGSFVPDADEAALIWIPVFNLAVGVTAQGDVLDLVVEAWVWIFVQGDGPGLVLVHGKPAIASLHVHVRRAKGLKS